MTDAEIREKLAIEPDFVAMRRVGYSLTALEADYPDGCPANVVATALRMPEEAVSVVYSRLIQQVRKEAES